jgi:hypothetical protein
MLPSGWVLTTTRSSASTRSRRSTTTPAGGKVALKWTSSSTRRRSTACRLRTRPSSAASAHGSVDMLAKYDALNPTALKQLVAAKTKVLPFSQDVMDASFKASMEVFAENNAKSPEWKKIYADIPQLPARPDPVVPLCRSPLRHLHARAEALMALRRFAGHLIKKPVPPAGRFFGCSIPRCCGAARGAARDIRRPLGVAFFFMARLRSLHRLHRVRGPRPRSGLCAWSAGAPWGK